MGYGALLYAGYPLGKGQDLLFTVHRIIMKFNNWVGAFPECPFIQLTTLDENKDAKLVSTEHPKQGKV